MAASDEATADPYKPAQLTGTKRKNYGKLGIRRSTEPPLPPEEVRRLAESEGLPLIVAPTHTGFKGVSMVSNNKGNQMTSLFALKINKKHAGSFATAEQAALAYSRHIGREAAVVEAAAAQKTLDRRAAVQTPEGRDMTVAEAEAVAAAEGLTLERSETHASGFKNVHLQTDSSRFFGRLNRVKVLQVGTHATPQAVALAMARQHRRDTEAAAAAAPSAEAAVEVAAAGAGCGSAAP